MVHPSLELLELPSDALLCTVILWFYGWWSSTEVEYFEALDNLTSYGPCAYGLECRDRSCLMGALSSATIGGSRDRANRYNYYIHRSTIEDANGDALSGSSSSAGDNR